MKNTIGDVKRSNGAGRSTFKCHGDKKMYSRHLEALPTEGGIINFIIDCVIKMSYIDKFHIIVTHTIAQGCTKKANACKELFQLIKLPT